MLDFMPRPRRYIEPDANDQKYVGIGTKPCTVCGRVLPSHPDFFGTHTVIAPNKRDVYRYRRPDCRSCRAEGMRRRREADAIIDERV